MIALCLFGLAACTEVGYTKPGMTEEEYVKDSRECADIARTQAFRDGTVFQSRARAAAAATATRHDQRLWTYQDLGPSMPELEFRYRRLCMLSRGYELAPINPDEESEEESADESADEPQ